MAYPSLTLPKEPIQFWPPKWDYHSVITWLQKRDLGQIWGQKLTACFERTKALLDPAGILNPGVIVPRPGQDPLEGLWPQHGGAA